MLDKFRNLSETGKMIVVSIIIVVFVTVIVIVSALIKTNDTPEPVPTVTPPIAQSSPATEEPEATPTPSASNTAPAPSPSATINYGETTLSIEDQKDAQNAAKTATLEYLKTDKGETNDAKNERLRQYFEPSSNAFDERGLDAKVGLETTDANNFVISVGSVDYIDPVGGTEQEYKVVAGATLKIQFNKSGAAPQILESNNTYVILLSKASGSWKVTSFIES